MSIFKVAKDFEELSMQRNFSSHTMASVELRGMLACLLDYWGIDRLQFSDALKEI
jgi:hypothetical protein